MNQMGFGSSDGLPASGRSSHANTGCNAHVHRTEQLLTLIFNMCVYIYIFYSKMYLLKVVLYSSPVFPVCCASSVHCQSEVALQGGKTKEKRRLDVFLNPE